MREFLLDMTIRDHGSFFPARADKLLFWGVMAVYAVLLALLVWRVLQP